MGNFTPGPWKLDGECFTAGGHYDAPRVFSHADPDEPKFIAEIAVEDTWEENGNLIAAAPEMYEALKGAEIMLGFLLEYAEQHPSFEKVSKRNANVTRVRILNAIEKAEGSRP